MASFDPHWRLGRLRLPNLGNIVSNADSLWHVEVTDRVAVISYDNPPMNYLGGDGLFQLENALKDARKFDSAAIVITGAREGFFITHFSVEEILAGQEKIKERGPVGNHRAQLLLERLNDMSQPVIAAMTGDTMGFGYELALACDFRIAQRGDFRIGLPEVRMGILPGAGGTQRLSRLVGISRALDLIMRARVLTPDEALTMGLVNQVVDDAKAVAIELAREFASLPPTAVAMAKSVIYGGSDLDLKSAQRLERDGSYRTKISPGASTAMQEFVALPISARRDWIDRRTENS
jgi:enoyl-CoA hydratase